MGVNAAASYFLPLRFFKILAFSDFVLNFMSAVIELVRFSNFDHPFEVQRFCVFNDESRRVLNYKGFDFLYIMETFRTWFMNLRRYSQESNHHGK
jgi:hypothetical protein